MQQHVLDDRVGALAVLDHLFKIAFQHMGQLVEFLTLFVVKSNRFESIAQFIDQLLGERGEIVDEIQWILDLVRDARGELPERGELLRLNKAILCGAQILQRKRKLLGSFLHLFEHADVADGDHRLIGKSLQQGNLLVAERMHFGAAKHDRPDALTLAHQGYAQNGAVSQAARRALRYRKFVAFGGEQVMHMHRFFVEDRVSRGTIAVDRRFVRIYRNRAVMCASMKVVTNLQAHYGIIGIAKLAGALDDGLEYRPDIGRRGGDHAQDLAATGLINQRFRKVAGLRLDLIEQSDIFDRDRCLVGKSRDQFDLLLGKRTRLRARQGDYADRNALAQHRNGEHSAETTQSLRFGKEVVGVCLNVGNVNHGPFQQSPPDSRASIRYNRNGSYKIHEFVRKTVSLSTEEHAVYLAGDRGLLGVA